MNESMIIKTDAKSNSDYSLQLNRWFLKPIGAWPYFSTTSTLEKVISVSLIIFCYVVILFSIIPCVAHLIFEDDSFYRKVRVFGPLGHWFIGGINYTNLLFRSKNISDCVEHIETDWQIVTKEKQQQVMLKHAKFGRYVSAICAIFVHSGIMSYCIVSASSTQIIKVGNETRTMRSLPLGVYNRMIPVDTSPANEIVLVMQFLSAFIADSSGIGFYTLASVLAAHACGQLSVLTICISDYVNEAGNRKEDTSFRKIGTIVEHHLRTLDFIARIEEVMSWVCMTELFRCVLAICMVGYYIVTEWSDHDVRSLTSYFIIFASVTFNTFLLCYIGELLTEQCMKVGEIVYMTNWYILPRKRILELILIIARSSVVIEITAGKLIHMSIHTFGDVMRLAFAYLNILCQMT
ncbi:odorant receptor 46a-like isoform X2 [Bombus affinis]|uniref:odorant receptor 46a-like isoform X2 n=1 Tax=Bombus affinis TaxID=309941 RepID=UPI0021B8201D|nr:odorant receptor 46a-like isoform X2 [Bombus affinis]